MDTSPVPLSSVDAISLIVGGQKVTSTSAISSSAASTAAAAAAAVTDTYDATNVEMPDLDMDTIARLISEQEQNEQEQRRMRQIREQQRREAASTRHLREMAEASAALSGSVFDAPSFMNYGGSSSRVPYVNEGRSRVPYADEEYPYESSSPVPSEPDLQNDMAYISSDIAEVKSAVEKIMSDVDNAVSELSTMTNTLDEMRGVDDFIASKTAEYSRECASDHKDTQAKIDALDTRMTGIEKKIDDIHGILASIADALRGGAPQ